MHEYKPVSASMFHQVFERWCNVSRYLYLGSCIYVSSWHNICSKVPYSLLSRSCLSARQLNFVPEVCCQCRACVHLSFISFLEIYISELKVQTVKINFSIGKIPWLNFERYVTPYSMGGTIDGKRRSENMWEARISFYGPTQNSLNFFRFAVLPPSILFADRPTYSCLLKLNRK